MTPDIASPLSVRSWRSVAARVYRRFARRFETRPHEQPDEDEGATSSRQSAAYRKLAVRTFTPHQLASLASEPLASFVPGPFQEAFEHPQSRPDADGASLLLDLLGRGGIAVGCTTVFLAALVLAIATGRYAPGARPAGDSQTKAPPPQQQQPVKPSPDGTKSPSGK